MMSKERARLDVANAANELIIVALRERIAELEKDNAKLNQRIIDQEDDHRLQIKDFAWFGE
jgi:hypothetical protein